MPTDSSSSAQLDHLVVCAQNCKDGVQWFEALSGVRIPAGGQHPLMATHNHLTALSEQSFLEIIAADPSAEPVARHCWFKLGDPSFQAQLSHSPLLTTWVVATQDLSAALAAATNAGIDAGEPVELTRGDLTWQLGLRADGTLACDGAFPILIQWPESVNPVKRMRDQGIRLQQLTLNYPQPDLLQQALAAIGVQHLANVEQGAVGLQADMQVSEHLFQLNSCIENS